MARPTSTASASVAAPVTSMVIDLLAPSASACICAARSAHARSAASVNSAGLRRRAARAAGQQQHRVVGGHAAVGVEPVEGRAHGRAQRLVQPAAGRSASVVSTTSMVASAGASMAAPLAMPPIWYTMPAMVQVFGTVSVVLIASAAASPPCPADAWAVAAVTPASSRSSGSRSPISPVEQTAISPAPTPSSPARCSAVRWVSWKPAGPVHAFAPPEFSATARTHAAGQDLLAPQHRRGLHPVGGEDARRGCRRPVVDHDGDIGIAGCLDPGGDPSGPEAGRAGDCHGCDSDRGEPGRLGQAEHEVAVLDGLPGRALAEVVDGGDDDGAAGPGVGGGLQVHAVRAGHRRGRRPPAVRQQGDERLAVVRRRDGVAQRRPVVIPALASLAVQVARMPRGIGASTGVKLTRTGPAGSCRPPPPRPAPARSRACAGARPPPRTPTPSPSPRWPAGRYAATGQRRTCRTRRRSRRQRGRPARPRPAGPARASQRSRSSQARRPGWLPGSPAGAGQFRQAGDPAAGVRARVVPGPGRRVGEPEVRARGPRP